MADTESPARTAAVSTDHRADLQDVIYSAQHGARAAATSDEVTAALLPIVDAHTRSAVEIELRHLAAALIAAGSLDAAAILSARADELAS